MEGNLALEKSKYSEKAEKNFNVEKEIQPD